MTNGLVVVLGHTGRNFAAGMTGGIAYHLDQPGDFAFRCNQVEGGLESDTSPRDIETLYHLIARHSELTGSPQARWIIENWETTLARFVKVFPHEYKRVLGITRASAELLVTQAAKQSRGQVIGG